VTAVHGYPHPPDAFFGNLVFRWFVGLSPDDPIWHPTRTGRILITSAKYLGTAQRDNYFGSGLVDPLAAIQAENNFLAPRAMTLPQAHARSSTILIDEFDAALF
jgi:hypothetical protein